MTEMFGAELVTKAWGVELFPGSVDGAWKGVFDPATAYQKSDIVSWNGATYQAKSDVPVLAAPSFVAYRSTNSTGFFPFPPGVQEGDSVLWLGYLAGPPYSGTAYGIGTHIPNVHPPLGGVTLGNGSLETSFNYDVGHQVGYNISLYVLTAADISAGGLTIPTNQGDATPGPAYTDFNAEMYVFRNVNLPDPTLTTSPSLPDPSNYVNLANDNQEVGASWVSTPDDSAIAFYRIMSLIEAGGSVGSGSVLTDEHFIVVSGQYATDSGYAVLTPGGNTPALTFHVTSPGLPTSAIRAQNFLFMDARYPSYSSNWGRIGNSITQALSNDPDSFGLGQRSVLIGRDITSFGQWVYVQGDHVLALGDSTVRSNSAIALNGTVWSNSDYGIAIGGQAGGSGAVAIGGDAFGDGAIALGGTYTIPNTADFAIAIGNAALLDGAESIILGDASYAVYNSPNVVAMGFSSGVQNDSRNSVSIGFNSTVRYTSPSAVAIGDDPFIEYSNGGIAIGKNAEVRGGFGAGQASDNSIAIGTGANATAGTTGGIAIGPSTTVDGDGAVVIGTTSAAHAGSSIAIGSGAFVDTPSGSGVAIGTGAQDLSLGNCIVIGNGAQAASTASNAVAIGKNGTVNGERGVSIGETGGSRSNFGIAIGYGAIVGGGLPSPTPLTDAQSGVAVGQDAYAGNPDTIAIGTNAFVSHTGSPSAVSIGRDATSAGVGALALGYGTNAAGNNSVALGRGASASAINTLALGANTVASAIGAVAIGVDSFGSAVQATNPDEIRIGTSNHSLFVDGTANFGGDIGFHGHGPVAQSPHPTTLADVITILSAHGLCA